MFRARNWKIGRARPRSVPARASRLSTRKAWRWPIPTTIPRPWKTTPPVPKSWRPTSNGVGTSIRHSATINQDLCYLALRLTYHGEPGYVLRLAVPLDDVDSSIAAVRWRILWASFYAALVALIFAYFFSQSFTRRIARLRAFAEGLVDAHFSQAPLPDADDELGALGRSLSTTAAQLRDLVDRLSVESAQREAILSSMVEGVLAVDSSLRITFANASFARAVGAANPIPAGMPLVELVRAPELREVLTRVLATRRIREAAHAASRRRARL